MPGDVSSGAFLLAAAALSGSPLAVESVGVNPSRCRFVDVMRRMGAEIGVHGTGSEVGEPVGVVEVEPPAALHGTIVSPDELPLVIDEIPILAMLAAHAEGESRFEGAGELRVKESDRLTALSAGIRELGGEASVEGDALVVAGGGLSGGRASARGDHRLAMALVVGALGANGPSEVDGIEWAAVSFPGFVSALTALGARIEVRS